MWQGHSMKELWERAENHSFLCLSHILPDPCHVRLIRIYTNFVLRKGIFHSELVHVVSDTKRLALSMSF